MKYEAIKLPSDKKVATLIVAVASAKKTLQDARAAQRSEQTIDTLLSAHISAQVQVIVGILELNLAGSLPSPPPPLSLSIDAPRLPNHKPTTHRTGTESCTMFFGSCVQDITDRI